MDMSEDVELPLPTRSSDEPPPKRKRWINRQRVLVFSARGITGRDRHLMKDLRSVMPHCKDENKMERREKLSVINEMCKMKNCNKCIFFESRKKQDLYMWISNVPDGPSAKFLIENVNTMGELKLTGNCLKGSRPILSFDENFKNLTHYNLLKELFVQTFGVPNHHPKSQPFFDRIITFSVVDKRIWFRSYQILNEDGALAEIGPRFVMNPIKIFNGSFGGETIWENPHYITPAVHRRQLKLEASSKYVSRQLQKATEKERRPKESYLSNPEDTVFDGGDAYEIAQSIITTEKILDNDYNITRASKVGWKKKQRIKRNVIKKKAINKFTVT